MKTSELTGVALDWAVAKCENSDWSDEDCVVNVTTFNEDDGTICNYSTDWAQGGPIIEREKITLEYRVQFNWWVAYVNGGNDDTEVGCTGPTPLIAAMRCYVASKLGDEIDLPKELNA